MKRKLMLLCFVAFCFMAGSFLNGNLVKADVIWEPPETEFIEAHRKECSYENRMYSVECETGYATVYVDPLSNTEVTRINNDERIRIMYRYTDEMQREWGMIYDSRYCATENDIVWVKMSELKLCYDNIEFCKDHESEFKPMDDRFDSGYEEVYCNLWTYPNSGVCTARILYPLGMHLQYLYVDEYGRTWSYMYYYQCHKGWICLDDPGNGELETISPKPSVTTSLLPTGTQDLKTSEPTILPTKTPEPTNSLILTEVPVPVKPLQCKFEAVNIWQGGFVGQFTITNKTNKTIKNWEASFTSDYEISSLWGAKLVSNIDGVCLVSNESWDAGIEPGDSRCFSFVAQGEYKDTPWDIDAVVLD